MHLVMFDLDGTLLKSNTLDTHCFAGALKAVLGVESVSGDWGEFEYVTDEGIVSEIAARKLNRPATRNEMLTIRAKILALLQVQADTNREAFEPIPGALDLFDTFREVKSCAVAIATGCWKDSARLKLSTAGFDLDNLPIASSDDSHRRDEIMQAAHQRALQCVGVDEFETVTYVGDGVWDLDASIQKGYQFIGIGFYDTEEALRRAGAPWVVTDYQDQAAFFDKLNDIWGGKTRGDSLRANFPS